MPPPNKHPLLPLLLLLATTPTQTTPQKPPLSPCQPITIPMCKGIGYNHTQMPNGFNHDSQEEAGLEVHQYWPLVEIKCSDDLRFFICSLYVPICMDDYAGPQVPPCRTVCERARVGCEPVMTHYGFAWPPRFTCSNFPRYGPGSICMDEKKGEEPIESTTAPPTKIAINKTICPPPLILSPCPHGKNPCCTTPCSLLPPGDPQRKFTHSWLVFWGVGSAGSSLVVLATFLLDRGRFPYPERPIIYLTLSYFAYSLTVVIFKTAITNGDDENECTPTTPPQIITTPNLHDNCFVNFIILYYFRLGAACWWPPLALSWYLAAASKWGSEAIAAKYRHFHAFGWGVPLVTMATVFFNNNNSQLEITPDPITGLCWFRPGGSGYKWGWLLPSGVAMATGLFLFLSGFTELLKIRKVINSQRGRTERLEKLMIRISVFSLFYTLPCLIVLGAEVYENFHVSMGEWSGGCGGDGGGCEGTSSLLPTLYLIVLTKSFLILIPGLTTGCVWIWSRKSWETWRGVVCCCFGGGSGRSTGGGVVKGGGSSSGSKRGVVNCSAKVDL